MTWFKDYLALRCILLARYLTTFGWTDDHLSEAEKQQRKWIKENYK